MRPGTASKVADLSYKWKDEKWLAARAEADMYIPAKQDIRPGGTGCCSASNCTLTVQYSF